MRVLLVDRSRIVRERLGRLLADLPGVRVAQAQSAIEARRAAKCLQPDAVVIDLWLTGGGGIQLLRDIKECGQETLLVVLTMEPSPTHQDWCMQVADLCLDKTHDIDALVEAIRERAGALAQGSAAPVGGQEEVSEGSTARVAQQPSQTRHPARSCSGGPDAADDAVRPCECRESDANEAGTDTGCARGEARPHALRDLTYGL